MLPAIVLALGWKQVTDVIHRSIDLHPLCVSIIDTPEFQRLRRVSQLGPCRWVFPGAVHDRFQHALGVAHLARSWTEHFRACQTELAITDADVLCVTLAGLLHDLGHGPLSHFWETCFPPSAGGGGGGGGIPHHEELSCAMVDRLLARNRIDASPWLDDADWRFVKALIRGSPSAALAAERPVDVRHGSKGVPGLDKRFLYDIVSNSRSGFDVDKLDYFERDCHYSGVVKVSFDRRRLMKQARVALARGPGPSDGQLQICWPVKCLYELQQVFQTRFSLHTELYQHRVAAAVGLMLRDAIALTDASAHFRVLGASGAPLRLSECGTALDTSLDGYLQLSDELLALVRAEATRLAASETAEAEAAAAARADESEPDTLHTAAALLDRLDRRDLYRFAGSVVLEQSADAPRPAQLAGELERICGAEALPAAVLRLDRKRVHYGCGDRNPVDEIRFFDNKEDAGNEDAQAVAASVKHARPWPSSLYAARLPGAFEEVSLRLFVTDGRYLPAARAAFDAWCEERALCNDACQVDEIAKAL